MKLERGLLLLLCVSDLISLGCEACETGHTPSIIMNIGPA